MFTPKLFEIFKKSPQLLKGKQLSQDIVAGVIVAIIALPLSIALAIASGVSPEKGLITAIVAGFAISAFGGSNVQIGGPTAAFVVIICNVINTFGVEGLIAATFLAGVFLLIFGLLKFGSVIKYIPYTITVGFTSGLAVTLVTGQINDFLGMGIQNLPSDFIGRWGLFFQNFSQIHIPTLLIGLLTLFIIIFWPKINKKIPGSLIALLVSTAVVAIFKLPVETIGSRFGEISAVFPAPKLPFSDLKTLTGVIQPAFTIAILAAVESLLSAVVADGMIGKKHNSNVELIGQGIGNIASSLFGGLPATGAIARTAANIKNGGRTPISGIVHSITLLLVMLILMPYAKLIPMTTLGAILIIVSYNMFEFKAIKMLLKSTKTDLFVLIITFVLTVVFDLVIAIEIGMILAIALIFKKISENTTVNAVEYFNENSKDNEFDKYTNKRILVYQINGPLFFGATSTFLDVLNDIDSKVDIVIFDMSNVTVLDATAYDAILQIEAKCKLSHILPVFSCVLEQPKKLLGNYGRLEGINKELIFDSLDEAYEEACNILLLKKKVDKKR